MMRKPIIVVYAILFFVLPLAAQKTLVDPTQFFTNDACLEATLIVPFKAVLKKSKKAPPINGQFICTMPDGTKVQDPIQVEPRGKFRRDYCYLPPLKIKFKKSDSSYLSPLKTLKLVNTCRNGNDNDVYVLKEYLIYKMYNMLSDMSFRVRLLHLNYEDSNDKKKPLLRYAFLIEDADDMAKRNGCYELPDAKINTESTDRVAMTKMALFQYMIGNTDWAVPVTHNIKIIAVNDSLYFRPIAVPYDFDYCGLVNTHYAIPDPQLGIEKVTERVYRGFPRNMEELNVAFQEFNQKKEAMFSMIKEFEPLPKSDREDMIAYLESFYKEINSPSTAEYIFVRSARQQ